MMRVVIALAIWVIVLALLLFATPHRGQAPQVPRCPEDAVLRGGGQFVNGYWDYLYCEVID